MPPTPNTVIWVFGNAVQDITVSVDLDTLILASPEVLQHLNLEETPRIKKGTVLKTQIGSRQFGVKIDFFDLVHAADEFYSLQLGGKYILTGNVEDLTGDGPAELVTNNVFYVSGEDTSWGGGGLNVCRFIRALAPNMDTVPLRYTDHAMSRPLSIMIQKLESTLNKHLTLEQGEATWVQAVDRLIKEDMGKAERLTSDLSELAAGYSPDQSLEVFLATLFVDTFLVRTDESTVRKNWIFSSFRGASRVTEDKIICRGKPTEPASSTDIGALLAAAEHSSVGAILLDSLSDIALFKAAYNLCNQLNSEMDIVVVLAMTMSMQQAFFEYGLQSENDTIPQYILVFNEHEATAFAQKLDSTVEPFMSEAGGLPDAVKFAKVVSTILGRCDITRVPRIYVTIGPKGSLGFDPETNKVLHVSYFSKQGDQLYDTNACGDAFCAAVTLLEWAKRNGYENIADHQGRPDEMASAEMSYFMGVATAAAYSKATDRRGRINPATLLNLLQHTYLGGGVVGTLQGILDGNYAPWVDREGRVRRPQSAGFIGVTEALQRLLGNSDHAESSTP